MPERFSDQHLEAVLASVGRQLVVPAGSAPVLSRPLPDAPRRSPRVALLVAATITLLLLVVGAAVAPVREAVADWLGIGSTSIERVRGPAGDPEGLPKLSAGAVTATPAQARAQLGAALPVVSDRALGPPGRLAIPTEGGVLLVWPRGQTTLWVHRDDGSGVAFVKKLLTDLDRVRAISYLGDGGALIEGPHVVETPTRRLAAGRTLLWVDGDLEYRLESDLPADRMVAIARSVSAPGR
jgi:hypothetical protein